MSCSPVVEVGCSYLGAAAAQDPALVDSADLMPDAAYFGDLSQEVHGDQLPAAAASCKSTHKLNNLLCRNSHEQTYLAQLLLHAVFALQTP